MKKLIAFVLALVVCLLWYRSFEEQPVALVPKTLELAMEPERSNELPVPIEVAALDEREAVEALASANIEKMVIVRATCVDEDQNPLKGIELIAMSISGNPSAFTNAVGMVELPLLSSQVLEASDQRQVFVVRSTGTLRDSRRHRISNTEDTYIGVFKLGAGGSVTGRVVNVHGEPVANASVYCSEPVLDRHTVDYEVRRILGKRPLSPIATSGEDGRYMIQGMPPSTYSVSAYSSGTLRTISEPIALRPEVVAKAEDLVLQDAPDSALIKGKVLARDGSPMPDVQVQSMNPMGNLTLARTRSGDLGEFTLPAEPGTTQTVMAGRVGHEPIVAHNVEAGTHDVILQDVDRLKILVQARTAFGQPLSSFRAFVRTPGRGIATGAGTGGAKTSSDGRPVELIAPHVEFQIYVQAASFVRYESGPLNPSHLPKVVNAVLEPLPSVTGQVFSGGVPVPGATVEGYLQSGSKYAERFASGLHRLPNYQRRLTAKADDDGRFSIELDVDLHLLQGFRRFHLRATGAQFKFGPEQEVTLAAGVEIQDVMLQVASSGAVEGRLFSTENLDLSTLFVSISRGDGEIRTGPVDVTGAFRFGDLAPGWWQAVSLDKKMLYSEEKRVVGATPIEDIPWSFEVFEGTTAHFELEHVSSIPVHGELSGQFLVDGDPPIGWSWRANQEGKRIDEGRFDGDGRFSIECQVNDPVYLSMGMAFDGGCGGASLSVKLQLHEGRNEWSYDLATASLLVIGLPKSLGDPDLQMHQAEQGSWEAAWQDDSADLTWRASLLCARADGLRLPQVPAGTLTVIKKEMYQPVESSEKVVKLKAGESGILHLGDD